MTATKELTEFYEREKREQGLIAMSFTPGSAREISIEEAASVALAMLKYEP